MAKASVVPFAHQPPLITILSDHASQDRDAKHMGGDAIATQADKDQLNLETRLASTFDILRHKNTRCPLAVAVYGDWGTGKTSAMRWLETRLKEWNELDAPKRQGHPRAYPVWFDPWRYHSKEEVWRGIIAEVILALFRVGNLNHENVLPRMVQAVKKFGGFLGRSFIHAVANMEFEAGGKAKVPALAEGEVKFSAKGEMFRDIWEEYDKAAHPHKAHLNQFEDTLRTWVTDFLGPQAPSDKKATGVTREPARLVLFIDDLDRCLPEVTLEVIEALKLYLNIDHLIFVVGLDETVVRSVVAEHYKKAGVDTAKAARYLDKVFQVDLRIPPSEAQMPDYMRTQIDALNKTTDGYWHKIMESSGYRETLEEVLISLARNNPREVKRLLNSALLRGRAASLDPDLTGDDAPADPEAERFAQGVQVFLLQRLLAERLLQSEDFLTYSQYLKWFTEASRLLRVALETENVTIAVLLRYLGVIHAPERTADPFADLRENPELGGPPFDSQEAPAACRALLKHLTTNPPSADQALWTSDIFLRLLQVPFSQSVAAHFPPPRIQKSANAPSNANGASLPGFLRERIAQAAEIPISDLQPEHIARLTHLSLSDTTITTDELRYLAAARSLEALDLSMCTGLRSLVSLPYLPSLKKLSLRGCTGLEGVESFQGLSKLESLQVLELGGCVGFHDTQVLASLLQLQSLSLINCTGLLSPVAFTGLSNLNSLVGLDLTGCTGFTDVSVLAGLNNLERLWLNGGTGLHHNACFQGLAELGSLQKLGLRRCVEFENTTVLANLVRLKTLDLSHCTGLKGLAAWQGLIWLADLKELDLVGCTGLEDTAVLAGLRQLESLNLSHCTGMKGRAAWQGLTELAALRELNLSRCRGLDKETLQALRQALPASCVIWGPDGLPVARKI